MATRPVEPLECGQLGEVIAAYLQAVERGETPDRSALSAAHPELASELAAYFADLDQLNRLAAPLQLSDPNQTTGLDGAADTLAVVKYFGDYMLEAELARGGMGVVFRARQKSLNRMVALKMILTGQLASPADVQRFQAEAEAAANLDHPNILPIYEVGEHEGRQYFTMKLVEGGSLAGKTKELLDDPQAAAQLIASVARAVHFAHQRGILHRDLKPANVLIDTDGTPYVTDFGLAKKAGGDCGLTHTGAVVGTPSYMSPEQARGEKGLTVGTDVYSLGAILFELLAGRPPFRAATVYETIKEVIEQEPVHPRTLNAAADRDLAAISLKCLAKSHGDRYASADELAADLGRWLAGEPTTARPPSLVGLAWRWLQRNAAAATTVVVFGILWGLLTGLAPIVGAGDSAKARPIRLLADGDIGFNPIGWGFRVRDLPAAPMVILLGVAALWLTAGWCLRAGARPRTPAAALGVAAATGLLAAWVCNLFFAPLMSTEINDQLYPLRAQESLTWRSDPDGSHFRLTQPDIDIPHLDLDYLRQFVPSDRRDPTRMESARAYSDAQNDLLRANRYYRATVGIWISQFFTLLFFLTASLSSGWAADYLTRSGRGLCARVFCYAEVYLPTIGWFLAAFTFVEVVRIVQPIKDDPNRPPLAPYAWFLAIVSVMVAIAYTGVLRRWHPAARIGAYVVCIGLMVMLVWQVV